MTAPISASTAAAARQGTRLIATGCTSTGGIGYAALRRLILASSTSSSSSSSPTSPSDSSNDGGTRKEQRMERPFHIILLSRRKEGQAVEQIREELRALLSDGGAEGEGGGDEVEVRQCDLADLKSVRKAATDILIDLRRPPLESASAPGTTAASASSSTSDQIVDQSSRRAFSAISPGRIDLLWLNAAVAKGNREYVKGEGDTEGDSGQPGALRRQGGLYEETCVVNHVCELRIVAASELTNHWELMLTLTNYFVRLSSAQLLLLTHLLPVLTTQSSPFAPRVIFTSSALVRQIPTDQITPRLDKYFRPPEEDQSQKGVGDWNLLESYAASKFLQVLGFNHLISKLRSSLPSPSGSASSTTQADGTLEFLLLEPGFIPSTSLNRNHPSAVGRFVMQKIFPLLPLPFVSTVDQGAQVVTEGMQRDFADLEWEDGVDEQGKHKVLQEEEGNEGGKGVSVACIVKSGKRQIIDPRTRDEELARRWWPAVVEKAWPL